MEMVKNKRALREKQKNDPFANEKGTGPIRNKLGTKPMRKAKKFAKEMDRKSARTMANKHMKEHGGQMDIDVFEDWSTFKAEAKKEFIKVKRELEYNVKQNMVLLERRSYLQELCEFIDDQDKKLAIGK